MQCTVNSMLKSAPTHSSVQAQDIAQDGCPPAKCHVTLLLGLMPQKVPVAGLRASRTTSPPRCCHPRSPAMRGGPGGAPARRPPSAPLAGTLHCAGTCTHTLSGYARMCDSSSGRVSDDTDTFVHQDGACYCLLEVKVWLCMPGLPSVLPQYNSTHHAMIIETGCSGSKITMRPAACSYPICRGKVVVGSGKLCQSVKERAHMAHANMASCHTRMPASSAAS